MESRTSSQQKQLISTKLLREVEIFENLWETEPGRIVVNLSERILCVGL
jgi:hypothetical protein